jgi:raffinose/stachyose/melibiose transport system permease protein
MRVARRELYTGRALLLGLVAITILPFLSIFTTALHPSGSAPSGLSWPADPQWGNFVEAFKIANMSPLLASSVFIVLAVVPVSLAISTMAGFAIGLLRIPGARFLLLLFIFGLTLPFEGIITPLYFLARQMGILNTRFAIVLPLIGLFMPFAVFWMRAHFVNMPSEISEAARVDGASTWDLFWRIHVPLARAPIASLGIRPGSGRGTPSSHWSLSRTRHGRWPAPSGPSGHCATDIRCCARDDPDLSRPGRSSSSSDIIAALLQGR